MPYSERTYIIGDKETGVLFLAFNPLRAAIVPRSEIEAYAARHDAPYGTVFGDVAAAIKGLILATDPPNGPVGGQAVQDMFASLVQGGVPVTDAEFCFISQVDTSMWSTMRHGFMPIEPVIRALNGYTGGDVPVAPLQGPGDAG